jgi:hypothetical protein
MSTTATAKPSTEHSWTALDASTTPKKSLAADSEANMPATT